MIETKKHFILCACGDTEHQLLLQYFPDEEPEEKILYVSILLTAWENFFQRLVLGIKYIFGYKSRYGAFDEILISPEETKNIVKYLQEFIDNGKN